MRRRVGSADRIVGLHGGDDVLTDKGFERACFGHGGSFMLVNISGDWLVRFGIRVQIYL